MSVPASTIPKGSLVLVTGVTGFIASHTALEFLKLGYKVRGTVRDPSKAKWVTDELFRSYVAKGEFEIVAVPDMASENAFDEATKGVSAVAHIATIATWDPNPNNVIPQTVAGAVNALKSASKESSVKQFVFTSTAAAAIFPAPNTEFHCDETSWNEAPGPLAWAPPPYDPSRGMITYMASKVEAEKAVWKFAKETKPNFTVNVVLPFMTVGEILNKNQAGSTADWVRQLYRGDVSQIQGMPCSKFLSLSPAAFLARRLPRSPLIKFLPTANYIHVRDIALMHIAAVLDPEVSNRRIHAWAKGFNWNDMLAVLRKLYPQKKFIDDLPNMGQFLGTVDDSLGLKLLKKWGGQDAWTPFEQGIKDALKGAE